MYANAGRQYRPFVVRANDDLSRLSKWLKHRHFNVSERAGKDKKGNALVSIGFARGNGTKPENRGMIVTLDRKLLEDVERTVQDVAKAQNGARA